MNKEFPRSDLYNELLAVLSNMSNEEVHAKYDSIYALLAILCDTDLLQKGVELFTSTSDADPAFTFCEKYFELKPEKYSDMLEDLFTKHKITFSSANIPAKGEFTHKVLLQEEDDEIVGGECLVIKIFKNTKLSSLHNFIDDNADLIQSLQNNLSEYGPQLTNKQVKSYKKDVVLYIQHELGASPSEILNAPNMPPELYGDISERHISKSIESIEKDVRELNYRLKRFSN